MPKRSLLLLLPAGVVLAGALLTPRLYAQNTAAPGKVADITKLPGEITAQYDYRSSRAGEGLEEVIDGKAKTKYFVSKGKNWIQWRCGKPATVAKYTLTSAAEAEDRDPLTWTLKGSTDGTTWADLDKRTNEDFPKRGQKREFSFKNTKPYNYFRLEYESAGSTDSQIAEWQLLGTGGGGIIPPVDTWKEHWFEHNQEVSLKYYDDDVAIYFDKDVDPNITWLNKYMGDVWRYTKKVYGDFGRNQRLYVICHTGKYSGGHPSTYLDESHDYRNVIDCGPGPWTTFDYTATAIPSHEVGHIVEAASRGRHESPAFGLWGDSKWMEIYQYDLYKGLKQDDYAKRWHDEKVNTVDNFPRAGSHWFRDWFFPIYDQYGGSKVLSKYFVLLSENFPTQENGVDFKGRMNWGQFVHFWSGAAGQNLQPLAQKAFGWTERNEAQFKKAKTDFPKITYKD